jgi:uncharacterized membrane protein YGL010W
MSDMPLLALLVAVIAAAIFAVDTYLTRALLPLGLCLVTVAWILSAILTGEPVTL